MGSATAEASTKGICEPDTIIRKLYLQTKIIGSILPLYFDNDRPGPKTLSRETKLSYGDSYRAYMKRKPTFLARNAYSEARVDQMEAFFEEEVKAGWERLNEYTEVILEDLRAGNNIEIKVYGHASPLAPSEYNLNLTSRRAVSLKNHFREHSEEMRQFVDVSQKLTFTLIPQGEPDPSKLPEGAKLISDNPDKPKDSVYSWEASRARRVDIIIESAKFSSILFRSIQQN